MMRLYRLYRMHRNNYPCDRITALRKAWFVWKPWIGSFK